MASQVRIDAFQLEKQSNRKEKSLFEEETAPTRNRRYSETPFYS
jgi:hypothetical protein